VSLESLSESLSRLPVVGPVVRALLKSRHDHAKDMAASIAYFSFFSLFPLFLGIIAVGSLFLDSAEIQSRLDRLLADTLPGSADFVRTNVETLIRLRGAAGVASIAGLLWSASKMFGAVNRGINRALGLTRTHPFYLSPLRYFLLTLTVSLLLFLSMAVSTGVDLLAQLDPGLFGDRVDNLLTLLGGHMTSYLFVFVMLGALYYLVPYERPSWREVLPGALFAAFLYELGKAGFMLYIENVAHLKAVYGSVSSIIVLLLWLYYSARVLLFGAELIAVRQEQDEKAPTTA
jgi:membrane protein